MSDCKQARAELDEFLRSETCASRAAQIREHLANCPDCEHEFEFSEAVMTVVRRSCRETAPEAIRARILDAIRQTPCGSGPATRG